MKRWSDVLAELTAAGIPTEDDVSKARVRWVYDLMDSPDFWNADYDSQASLLSEFEQDPPMRRAGLRGALQSGWNAFAEGMSKLATPLALDVAAGAENLIEGAAGGEWGEGLEKYLSPEAWRSGLQEKLYEAVPGTDTTVPEGFLQTLAAGVGGIGPSLGKLTQYTTLAGLAAPTAPIVAGALGFGGYGATEALNAELPLDEVAKEALIQAGLGSVIGLAGKIPNAAVRSAVEAGVFGGESAVQSGLEGQYGEGGDTGAAVANALIAAGIPLGMHGMKRLMTGTPGAEPPTKAKPAPIEETTESEGPAPIKIVSEPETPSPKTISEIQRTEEPKPPAPIEEIVVEETPDRTALVIPEPQDLKSIAKDATPLTSGSSYKGKILTEEQRQELLKIKEHFDIMFESTTSQESRKVISQREADQQRKGLAMQRAAAIRKILGTETPTERRGIPSFVPSDSVRGVAEDGTTVEGVYRGMGWGKAKIELPSGTIVRVPFESVKRATPRPVPSDVPLTEWQGEASGPGQSPARDRLKTTILQAIGKEGAAEVPRDATEPPRTEQENVNDLLAAIEGDGAGEGFSGLMDWATRRLGAGEKRNAKTWKQVLSTLSRWIVGSKEGKELNPIIGILAKEGRLPTDAELAPGGKWHDIGRRVARIVRERRMPGSVSKAPLSEIKSGKFDSLPEGMTWADAFESLIVDPVPDSVNWVTPDTSESVPLPNPATDLKWFTHQMREGGSVGLPNSPLTRANIAREGSEPTPLIRAAMNDPGLARQIDDAVTRSKANISKVHQAINRVLISTWGKTLYLFGGKEPGRFLRETAVIPGEDLYPQTFADLITKYGGDMDKARAELYGSAGREGQNTTYRGLYLSHPEKAQIPDAYARRMIALFTAADSATFRHEIGHMMYDLLPDSSKQILHTAVGAGRSLTREQEESVAEYLRAHIESGIPVKGMEGEYARVRAWVRSLAEQGKKTGALEIVHPEVQQELMNLASVSPDLTRAEHPFGAQSGNKAVDESGRPLVLFHGTTGSAIELNGVNATRPRAGGIYAEGFDPSKFRDALYGPGVYMTSDQDVAEGYANKHNWLPGIDKPGRVYPLHSSIKNPLDLTSIESSADFLDRVAKIKDSDSIRLAAKRLRSGDINRPIEEFVRNALEIVFYEWHDFDPYKHILNSGRGIGELARRLGYDGIRHIGGLISRGRKHDVWIAFDPTQVKHVLAERFDRTTPDIMADLSEPEPGTFRSGIGGKAVLKYVKENTSDPFKYPEFRALGKKLQRPTHLSTLKPRTFTLTRGGRGVTGATLKFKVYKTANPNGPLDEAGEPLFPPGATGTGAPKAFYQLVHRDGGESVAFAGAVDAGAALRDGLQETGLTRRKVQERISDFFSFVSEKWGLAGEKNSDFFRELDEMEIPDPANPGQTYRPGREFLAGLSADVVRREDGHFELQPRASRERSLLAQWMDDTVRPLDRKIIGLLGTSGKKLVLLAEAATHRTRQLSRPIMDKLDQILHGLSAQEIAEFAAATAVEAKPEDLSPKALEAYRKWHSDSDGAGLFSSRRMALEARGHADTPLEQLLYQRHSILRLVKRHVLQRIRKGFMTLEDWKEWDGEDGKRNDARMAFAQLLDLTRDKLDRMSPEEIANIQKNLRDLRIPVSAMESNPGPMVSRIATEAAKAKAWAANGGEAYRAYTELLQTLEPGSEEWRSVKEHQRQSLDRSGAGDKDMYISNAPFFRKAQQWAVMGALTGRAIIANALQPALWIPQYGPRKWFEALGKTLKKGGLQRESGVGLGGIFQIPGSTAAIDRVSKMHPFAKMEAFVRGFAKNLADIEVKDLKERAKQGDKMAMRDLEKFVADVGRFLREGVEEALEPGAISEQEVASLALAERLALSMRSTSVPAKWVTSDLWKALTTLKRFPLQQYLQVKDALWGDFQEARRAGAEKDGSLKKAYRNRMVKRLMGYGITGAASGFIVNTIWNAFKGTVDQSILWKSQHLDDNDRNDLLEISEMYGKSLIDSGLTGWLADTLGDISRHFYGKDIGLADSALGFNLSRLQEAIGFAGDLSEGMLQASQSIVKGEGRGAAARNLGAKSLRFAETTLPFAKIAEAPRGWGGRGLGDVLAPDKEADRLRKAINEAVKIGDRRQARKLLEQYRKAALRNLSGARSPAERKRWMNVLKRMKGLTSRPQRAKVGG